ncbi:MAG: hypothetical protein ABI608_10930, partial [Rhizomicrobium sp.]
MIGQVAVLNKYARICVFAVVVICGAALAGWLLGIPVLASIMPGWPRMARIVLFCFLLCSAAVLELASPPRRRSFLAVRIIAASVVLAINAYALIGFAVAGVFSGAPPTGDIFGLWFGRPSPATAFNFLTAAVALMLPRDARFGRLFSGLITAGLIVTAFDCVGYAYGIAALSRGPTISTMSLPTMSSFVLFYLSALLVRPGAGWTAVMFARNSAGVTARRLFPIVLVFPFILNAIVLVTHRAYPFEAPLGFAVLAVATSIGLGIVTIVIAD